MIRLLIYTTPLLLVIGFMLLFGIPKMAADDSQRLKNLISFQVMNTKVSDKKCGVGFEILEQGFSSITCGKSSNVSILTRRAALFLDKKGSQSLPEISITKYFVDYSSSGINYAHFEGGLGKLEGAKVMMRVKGEYAGKPLDKTFAYDFAKPLESIKAFADGLLK